MGSEAATKSPFRGPLRDASGGLKGVVEGGTEGGRGGREIISDRGDNGNAWRGRGGGRQRIKRRSRMWR